VGLLCKCVLPAALDETKVRQVRSEANQVGFNPQILLHPANLIFLQLLPAEVGGRDAAFCRHLHPCFVLSLKPEVVA